MWILTILRVSGIVLFQIAQNTMAASVEIFTCTKCRLHTYVQWPKSIGLSQIRDEDTRPTLKWMAAHGMYYLVDCSQCILPVTPYIVDD
jgi:hypothetical protein